MRILEWGDSGPRARVEARDMVDLVYGPGRVGATDGPREMVVQVVGLDRLENYLDRLVSAVPEAAPHRRAMEGGLTIFEVVPPEGREEGHSQVRPEPEVRAEVWVPWPLFQEVFRRGSAVREFPAPIRIKPRGYDPMWTSGWRAVLEFPPRGEYEAADLTRQGEGGPR